MGKNKLLDWCYQSTFWGVSLCISQCACFSTSVILQIILSLNGGKFSFCSFLFIKICSHCFILKGKLFFEFCEYNCTKEGWFLYNIEEKSYCHHFGIYRQIKDIPLISSLPTRAYKPNPAPPPPPPPLYTLQTWSLLLHFCRVFIITEQVKCGAVSVFVSVSASSYG